MSEAARASFGLPAAPCPFLPFRVCVCTELSLAEHDWSDHCPFPNTCCHANMPQVLQLLADFLDALSYPAGRRDAERSMREQLLAVEAALSAGDMLPRPLAPLVPLSPSVSLSSSLVM